MKIGQNVYLDFKGFVMINTVKIHFKKNSIGLSSFIKVSVGFLA